MLPSAGQWNVRASQKDARRLRMSRSSDRKNLPRQSGDRERSTWHMQSVRRISHPLRKLTPHALRKKSPPLPHRRHQEEYPKHHPQTAKWERLFLHRLSQRSSRGLQKMREGQYWKVPEAPALRKRHVMPRRNVPHNRSCFRHA